MRPFKNFSDEVPSPIKAAVLAIFYLHKHCTETEEAGEMIDE
jgi:hypothetical protein